MWTFPSRPEFPAQTIFWQTQTHVLLLLQIRAIIVTNTCKKSEPFHLASNFQPRSILGDPIHLKPKVVKKFGQLSQSFWGFRNHNIFLKLSILFHFFSSHPNLSHIFSSRVKIISKRTRPHPQSPIIDRLGDHQETAWSDLVVVQSFDRLLCILVVKNMLLHFYYQYHFASYIDEVSNLGIWSTIVTIKK